MYSEHKKSVSGIFWANIAKLVSGSLLSQGLIFISVPVLTRMYSPDAFGVAALFTSIVLFLSPMSTLGYHQAIILPEDDNAANSVSYLSLLMVVVFTSLLLIPFFLFSKEIANFFNSPALADISWLIPFAVFCRGTYLVLTMDSSRDKTFGLQAVSTVIQTLMDRFVILGVGFLGYTTGATIIWGRFLASLCETGVFTANFKKLIKSRNTINGKSIVLAARKHKDFPLFANCVTFFSLGATHLPIYVLSYFFSPQITGLYALCNRLINLPMQLFGNALRRVYYQAAAIDQDDFEALGIFFVSLREKLFGYGLFPFMVLAVCAEDLFSFFLGANWTEAGRYAQILCILSAAQLISAPIATLVNVVGRQKQFLLLTCFLFLTRLVSLVIGGLNNDPLLALWLMAISGVLFYCYLYFWIGSYIGVPTRTTLKVFIKYIGLNFIFTGILIFFKHQSINNYLFLVIISISTVFYYSIVIFLVDKISPISILFVLAQHNRSGGT